MIVPQVETQALLPLLAICYKQWNYHELVAFT